MKHFQHKFLHHKEYKSKKGSKLRRGALKKKRRNRSSDSSYSTGIAAFGEPNEESIHDVIHLFFTQGYIDSDSITDMTATVMKQFLKDTKAKYGKNKTEMRENICDDQVNSQNKRDEGENSQRDNRVVDSKHLYTPDLSKIAISDTDIQRCRRSWLNDTCIDSRKSPHYEKIE